MQLAITLPLEETSPLEETLRAAGLKVTRLQEKGVADLNTLLIALGGGAGIAAIVKAASECIRVYFEGKKGLEGQRSIRVRVKDTVIQVSGGNLDQSLRTLAEVAARTQS